MKILIKKNSKLLIVFMSLAVSMLGFSSMDKNNVNAAVAVDAEPLEEYVPVNPSVNMLNIDTAVITDVRVESVSGTDNEVTMTFSNLPNISEKIFAVLVDEAAGGVIQSKYLDGSNSVTFDRMLDSIKVPGVHLYKQGANDEPFLLRRENFIASTSYMMPKVRSNLSASSLLSISPLDGNGDLLFQEDQLQPKERGRSFSSNAVLEILPIPNVFVFDFPLNTLEVIEGASGLDGSDLLAAVIAEDENGNTLDVRQWVATQYVVPIYHDTKALSDGEPVQREKRCKFEFVLPGTAKKAQIHLYKHGLFRENFLCKYLVDLNSPFIFNPISDEGLTVL